MAVPMDQPGDSAVRGTFNRPPPDRAPPLKSRQRQSQVGVWRGMFCFV